MKEILKTVLTNGVNELGTFLNAPIFSNPGFYIGLFGLLVTFGPRFQLTFTQAEIGQVTSFIGLVFGVTPATLQYMQLKVYQARVKAAQAEANATREAPLLMEVAPRVERASAPFQSARSTTTLPPPPPPAPIQTHEIHP